MASRLVVCALVLLACGGRLASTAGDVDATRAVTFPQGWVGYAVTAPLTLTNGSPSPRTVHLELPAPFTAGASDFALQGGESRQLELTFAPTEAGAYELDAHLTGELTASVHLSARANVPPACQSEQSCVTLHFDPAIGGCQSEALPDGQSCGDPCIEQGVCLSGRCMGTPKSCDDGDACTVDACGVNGCVHTDVSASCPAPFDPCQAAYCDPAKGCQSATVSDGTHCGPNDCTTAHVCILGQCVARPAPEGSLCATASMCQGEGFCHASKCLQPDPVTLTPKWTYVSPVSTGSWGDVAADAHGNLYFVQYLQSCDQCEATAPGPYCQLVSLDPNGSVRWIAQHFNGCTRWAVDDVFGQLYLQEGTSTLDALALDDGSQKWQLDVTTLQLSGANKVPTNSDRSVASVALSDSRGPLFVRVSAESEWVVGVERATGTMSFNQPYAAGLGTLLGDDQGVVFLATPTDGSATRLVRLGDSGAVMLDAALGVHDRGAGLLQFGQTVVLRDQGPSMFDASSGVSAASFGNVFWGGTVGDRYTLWVNDAAPFVLPDTPWPMLAGYDPASGAARTSFDFGNGQMIWEAMVTDRGHALAIADDDTGLHAATYLFEGDTRGEVRAKCPVRDEALSGSLLGDGTLYLRTMFGVAAYDLPGYRLGASGWVVPGGSPARSFHAR